MWAEIASVVLSAASKSGAGAPPATTSGSNGNFANQTMVFGVPDYTPAMGGMGPSQNQAFKDSSIPRADSLVMGMTGQSTTAAASMGINGIGGINLGSGGNTWALILGAAAVVFLILKK